MMSTFEAAITAHVLWHMRITAALRTGDLAAIDTAEAVQDDACELGRWIRGPGAVFSGHAVFQEFTACHRSYHASLGRIIGMIEAGDMAGARQEMGHGAFAHCSQDVVVHILKLEKLAATMPAAR